MKRRTKLLAILLLTLGGSIGFTQAVKEYDQFEDVRPLCTKEAAQNMIIIGVITSKMLESNGDAYLTEKGLVALFNTIVKGYIQCLEKTKSA